MLIHFYYDVDEWELYDLKSDPDEMNNRYNDPKYAQVKKNLPTKLKALQVLYKDNSDHIDNPAEPVP